MQNYKHLSSLSLLVNVNFFSFNFGEKNVHLNLELAKSGITHEQVKTEVVVPCNRSAVHQTWKFVNTLHEIALNSRVEKARAANKLLRFIKTSNNRFNADFTKFNSGSRTLTEEDFRGVEGNDRHLNLLLFHSSSLSVFSVKSISRPMRVPNRLTDTLAVLQQLGEHE